MLKMREQENTELKLYSCFLKFINGVHQKIILYRYARVLTYKQKNRPKGKENRVVLMRQAAFGQLCPKNHQEHNWVKEENELLLEVHGFFVGYSVLLWGIIQEIR